MNSINKPTDTRSWLRQATREAHQKLDGRMGKLSLLDSVAGYAVYLAVMETLYARYDHSLQSIAASVPRLRRDQPILELIRADRAELPDDHTSSTTVPALSLPNHQCQTTSPGATEWGQAYVLEGSAMGARGILPYVKKQLPGDLGFRFLEQLNTDAKERFSPFLLELSAASIDPVQAAEAAGEVFDTATRLVDQFHAQQFGSPE